MLEEDENKSPHVNLDETGEEVQDMCPAFDDDLDSEVDDFTIEEDNCVFMTMVHLVNPHPCFEHGVQRPSGSICQELKAKGF
jgi:hypothetical protein